MWKFRAIRAETALAAIAMRWAEEEANESEEEAWDRERRWIVFEKRGQASKPQCGKPKRWWQWPQIIARSQQPKQQRQWMCYLAKQQSLQLNRQCRRHRLACRSTRSIRHCRRGRSLTSKLRMSKGGWTVASLKLRRRWKAGRRS